MTPELQHRLGNAMPPFDGLCVHNVRELDLSQLRELLTLSISWLSPLHPEIYEFSDWHEHDGFIRDAKRTSWLSLNAAAGSDRTLFDSRDDDAEVRIAFYPPTFDWLLRYNIDQDDESDFNTALCDFDLSVGLAPNSSELSDRLLAHFPKLLTQYSSQSWFKTNYGG